MLSCHKLTNISIWDIIQQFVSSFLLLSGDGKDVADLALETEELSSILENKESLNLGFWNCFLIIPCFSNHSLKEKSGHEIPYGHLTP